MELTRLALSENVRAEVEQNPLLEIEATIDLEFDTTGNLMSPFVEVAAH
jgi:DNA-directed RNA polymerase specialized sigma54-like protein